MWQLVLLKSQRNYAATSWVSWQHASLGFSSAVAGAFAAPKIKWILKSIPAYNMYLREHPHVWCQTLEWVGILPLHLIFETSKSFNDIMMILKIWKFWKLRAWHPIVFWIQNDPGMSKNSQFGHTWAEDENAILRFSLSNSKTAWAREKIWKIHPNWNNYLVKKIFCSFKIESIWVTLRIIKCWYISTWIIKVVLIDDISALYHPKCESQHDEEKFPDNKVKVNVWLTHGYFQNFTGCVQFRILKRQRLDLVINSRLCRRLTNNYDGLIFI